MLRNSEGYVGEGSLEGNWVQPGEPPPSIWWYRSYFFEKNHTNFFATDTPLGAIAISICLSESGSLYYVILRTLNGVETFEVEADDNSYKKGGFWRIFQKKLTKEQHIIRSLKPELKNCKFTEVNSELSQQKLLELESLDVFDKKYRIGLVYSKPTQNHETEMFCNTESSPAFMEFLEFIGDIIQLNNWKKYHGGLDVTNGSSGAESVYTEWEGGEIMWHVPTLMPFFNYDEQQLERKKQVGNDRAVIVFREEGGDPLPPNTISSKAILLFFLVQPFTKEGDVYYRVGIACKGSVPNFGPAVPESAEFKKGPEFRNFLLSKLVNGIQATSHAEEFKPLMTLKYKQLLAAVCNQFSDP